MTSTIKIDRSNSEKIGEFMGLFAGDGYIFKSKHYSYRTYLFVNKKTEEKFAENLANNLLLPLFGKRPTFLNWNSCIALSYYSKSIHKFIEEFLKWDKSKKKTYSVQLKHINHSKEFKIGFIRGSLDSDGHFSNKKVNLASVSYGLIKNISIFLNDLNINNSIRPYSDRRGNRATIYHIDLARTEHQKFIDLIKPRNVNRYARAGI